MENPSVPVKIVLMIGAYGLLILKQGSGLWRIWRVEQGLVSCKDLGLRVFHSCIDLFWTRLSLKFRGTSMILTCVCMS